MTDNDAIANSKKKQSPMRRMLSIALPIVVAIVLLILAFRGVDWNAMLTTMQQGRIEWLAIAFLVQTVSYFMRSLRWRVLLSAEKRIHPLTVFWGTNVGYLGNAFLPARAGELLRTAFINRRTGIQAGFVLATVLTERILDAGFLVMAALIVISQLDGIPEWLLDATRIMGILGSIAFLGLILLPYLDTLIKKILSALPLPERIFSSLSDLLDTFIRGVQALQHPVRALSFLLWTLILWSVDVIYALTIAQAFNLTLTIPVAILLLAAMGLASAAPSTPGYIGIYQFVAVTVLTPFAITQDEALVYILALQAVTYILLLFWGGIAFAALTFSQNKSDTVEVETTVPSADT